MMRQRPFGGTGLILSELTFGTAAFVPATSEALGLALASGINAIELESGSEAEALVSAVVGGRPVHILSRVPSLVRFDLPSPHIPANHAYPGAHVRARTEASLKRLGVERLACQMIPAWCSEWFGEGDWLETLVALKHEGKIAAAGVSLFDHDVDSALQVAASGAIDCIELMYNIFDPGAAAALLPLCAKQGIAVIARSPFYFGALTDGAGKPFSGGRQDYFYAAHLEETRQRVAAIQADIGGVTDCALRFALSHPAISTVAVGMSSPAQVEANVAVADRGPLDAGTLEKLRQHRWLC
jgi:aryl-alcohol dehydrogenase-like predicted oxidoreductase